VLALLRPSSWDLPLFVHLLGAFALAGGLLATVVLALAARRRRDHHELLERLALRTVLAVVVPAWILMRAGAQWILSKEKFAESSDWVGIGFGVSDAGALVLVVLAVLAWRAARTGSHRLSTATVSVGSLYLAALAVAWWAMTTKPGSGPG
jgi:hypothetical protein